MVLFTQPTRLNYMYKQTSKGFTLIELMVTITIIAVLSGGILVSLSTSKGRGNNASIRTAFAQLRTESNLYINNFDNYGIAAANGTVGSCDTTNTFFKNTRVSAILAKAQASSGYQPKCFNTLGSSGAWATSIQLSIPEAGTKNFLCVDSLGNIKNYVTDPMPTPLCP